MGIPKFYRWLSERYPLINERVDGPVRPEFDCLYLDMNGIFHNYSYGAYTLRTPERAEMFANICKQILYLVSLIKPKRLLYLAVDGVAPTAKQNQQRKRRFLAARKRLEEAEQRKEQGRRGLERFDSNNITPGTEFMEELNKELRIFITKQISENGLWKSLTVIYSDHLSPGEGEHKIMSYIRHMKMQPETEFDHNTRHCIYGLDADLIILGLVSHELHFTLLREEVIFAPQQQEKKMKANEKQLIKKQEFQLLHIGVLRHYLKLEFVADANINTREKEKPSDNTNNNASSAVDLERIIDDFVFLCALVGNDFLPSIPTIKIATGGLEYLLLVYKNILSDLPDYLTYRGKLNMESILTYFKELATIETAQLTEQLQFLKDFWKKSSNRQHNPDIKEPTIEEIEEGLTLLKGMCNIFFHF
ncbi:ribonuclease related family member [Reticulomyxa filosa]|uniref:Ribonuclease related family member n=1 Tax=Reticulomyxa filosa TaxID=46433 RepID=X6LFQ9_RETFI|nr:ribonuclease related family member [Reticulomyxa filosa]|eukprot:ETN99579.1 ribonuclease related family member [Reticulomyxa filosa]